MNPDNPNAQIHRVLTGLNNTPTPTGLEHRVLQHLHTRTSPLAPRSWTETLQSLAAAPWLRIATTTAAVAGLLITFATTHTQHPNPSTAQPQSATPQTQSQSLPKPYSAQTPRPPRTPRLSFPATHPSTAPLDLATLETRAPSLPPPTLPLTADERLMQTAVRHSELPQLAELHTPDPPPTGIAPIFAGFLSRPDDEPPPADSDLTPALDPTEIATGDIQ